MTQLRAVLLLRAAHIGPSLTVTAITTLLGISRGLDPATSGLLAGAVFAGQLTVGWGNDLLDAARDSEVGRRDKPLATGQLSRALVVRALVVAAVAAIALALAVGWRSGLTHLCLVAVAHLYNLRLKATVWSWLPYAVAFGGLPAVVTLAADPATLPPAWLMPAAAALGVGAHFLNTLPDLADDRATGVNGLPHRLGVRPSRIIAVVLLGIASIVAVLGPQGPPGTLRVAVLPVVGLLAVPALKGGGRTPFRAAMAIAAVDVALLATADW